MCPAASLSFNAFKTVMEIDTMGTFNTSKVVYEKWFQVQYIFCQELELSCLLPHSAEICRNIIGLLINNLKKHPLSAMHSGHQKRTVKITDY